MTTRRDIPISAGFTRSISEIYGKSTDEKPADVMNGSMFYEMDTGTIYLFDGEAKEWLAQ